MKRLYMLSMLFALATIGSIWMMAYAVHLLPEDSWMQVPLLFTGVIFVVGFLLAAIVTALSA